MSSGANEKVIILSNEVKLDWNPIVSSKSFLSFNLISYILIFINKKV